MATTIVMPTTLFIVLLSFLVYSQGGFSSSITFVNNCGITVWPALLTTSGSKTEFSSTAAFALPTGGSRALAMPQPWSGRAWGRTLCSQDSIGNWSCTTGDCGDSSTIECLAGEIKSPATVVEIALSNSGEFASYKFNLFWGYNIAINVVPQGGGSKCPYVDCAVNLATCPANLMVADGGGNAIGCRSFGGQQPLCWSSEPVSSNCTCSYKDITIIFEPSSLIASGVTTSTTDANTAQVLEIIGIAAGVLVSLLAGIAVTIRCCNNACNTNGA